MYVCGSKVIMTNFVLTVHFGRHPAEKTKFSQWQELFRWYIIQVYHTWWYSIQIHPYFVITCKWYLFSIQSQMQLLGLGLQVSRPANELPSQFYSNRPNNLGNLGSKKEVQPQYQVPWAPELWNDWGLNSQPLNHEACSISCLKWPG